MLLKHRIIIGWLVLGLIVWSTAGVLAQSSKHDTDELQLELEALQKEIDLYEGQLSSVRSEKNSISRKVNEFKIRQNKIKLQIQQTDLQIKDTEGQLVSVEQDIGLRQEKIVLLQEQLAELIRLVEKKDHYSWLEILISRDTLGDFFLQLNEYNKIFSALAEAIKFLNIEKEALTVHQQTLDQRHEDQVNLIAIANLQNQELSGTLSERNKLLRQTQAEEDNYQAMLADRQKRAAEIRSRIYDLLGISQNITFGQAVQIAEWAEGQTGVRVAFLLAVLSQESNLGKNVGTCNRLGDPEEKGWQVIMKPTRDQEPFLAITEELGMDPDITPVSCPMRDRDGNQVGWGGAMGPAQFIPSTWIGYKERVSALTGKPANPWDIRDAFLGAVLLLKDNGAGSKDGEWAAAMRYFSGSTNPRFSFYGDSVVNLAEEYQQDIDDLND